MMRNNKQGIGLGFLPITPQTVQMGLQAGWSILSGIGFGSGRKEADAIVPVQDSIANAQGTGRLDEINRMIDSANITALQQMYSEVLGMAIAFREFVTDPQFTDGRASHQALNTLMPLLDGTDASGQPCAVNAWGNPCNGGTLGTIARRLQALGGTVPPPQAVQGYGSAHQRLTFPTQQFPYIPQGGTLPTIAPLSPVRSAGIQAVGGSFADMLPMLLLGGAVIFMLSRRR